MPDTMPARARPSPLRSSGRDTRPADWIEVYLKVAARCGHIDAAYHLGIRLRARGHDDQAAFWFSVAARKGHLAAPDRFETIYKEIRQSLDDEWDPSSGG
jgi:TPR repeat protein